MAFKENETSLMRNNPINVENIQENERTFASDSMQTECNSSDSS